MVKLVKPDLVSHYDSKKYRCVIYSSDFQPHGPRLATAGGDGTAKIWNVDSLFDASGGVPNSLGQSSQDSLLATIDPQSGTINVCRWSPDGSFLAIGDDCNIFIYARTPGSAQSHSFGSKHVPNKENWTRKFLLQGHAMDVIDISWSPSIHSYSPTSPNYHQSMTTQPNSSDDGSNYLLLASGSIDNKVILWHVPYSVPKLSNNQGNPVNPVPAPHMNSVLTPQQVLQGHTSFVKGVAFDPIGRYLISVGADNVIIVWENEVYNSIPTAGSSTTNGSSILDKQRLSAATLSFLSGINHQPNSLSRNASNGTGIASLLDSNMANVHSGNSGGHKSHTLSNTSAHAYKWIEASRLTDSLKESADKTLFRRSDWSIDGSCMCISNCVKSSKPIGNVIKRLHWSSLCDLVGHESSVTCCRFLPQLLVPPDTSNSDIESVVVPVSVVAMGDQFGVVSIWNTNTQRAIMICRDIFANTASTTADGSNSSSNSNSACGITDLSWRYHRKHIKSTSTSGVGSSVSTTVCDAYTLVVTSMEGSIALIEFTAAELGQPCSTSVLNNHYSRLYGLNYTEQQRNSHNLNYYYQEYLTAMRSMNSNSNINSTDFNNTGSMEAPKVNILTGRSVKSKSGAVLPFTSTITSAPAPVTIINSAVPVPAPMSAAVLAVTNITPLNASKPAVSVAASSTINQIVSKSSNGKKRITPMLMSQDGETIDTDTNSMHVAKIARTISSNSTGSGNSIHQFMSKTQTDTQLLSSSSSSSCGDGAIVGGITSITNSDIAKVVPQSVLTIQMPMNSSGNGGFKCSIPYHMSSKHTSIPTDTSASTNGDASVIRLVLNNGIHSTPQAVLAGNPNLPSSNSMNGHEGLLHSYPATLMNTASGSVNTSIPPSTKSFELIISSCDVGPESSDAQRRSGSGSSNSTSSHVVKSKTVATISCRQIADQSSSEGQSTPANLCWSTVYLSHITAVTGFRHANSGTLIHNLIVMGTAEGTIVFMNAITGLRIGMPVVVGHSVAHVHLLPVMVQRASPHSPPPPYHAQSIDKNMNIPREELKLLVVSATGDIVLFQIHEDMQQSSDSNSNGMNISSSNNTGDVASVSCTIRWRQVLKISMEPLLQTIHATCGVNNHAITGNNTVVQLIECCFDQYKGSCGSIVVNMSYEQSTPATAGVSGNRPSDPVYCTYVYDVYAQCWSEELSTLSSGMFALSKYYQPCRMNLHATDVLSISNTALLLNNMPHESKSISSTGAVDVVLPVHNALLPSMNTSIQSHSSQSSQRMQSYIQLANLSQLEDLLARCVYQLSHLPVSIVGSNQSLSLADQQNQLQRGELMMKYKNWYVTWIQMCCQNQLLLSRVENIVHLLLQDQYRHQTIGPLHMNHIMEITNTNSNTTSGSSSRNKKSCLFPYLSNDMFLREIIIPTLQSFVQGTDTGGRSDSSGNSSISNNNHSTRHQIQKLLMEINDCSLL